MPDQREPWHKRLFPAPLRRAFAALPATERGPPLGEEAAYQYDESSFVRFEGADLDEDVNPRTRQSGAGFTGCAEFRHLHDPTTPGIMPFAVDHAGRKLTGTFFIEYDALPRRVRHLRENGIRPSETLKAIEDLDAKLNALRRNAGLNGTVLLFPAPNQEP